MATIPPSEITRRVESLRQWMRQRGLSAFVIPSTDPHASEYVPDHWLTRQWISGFDGSAGTAVVTLTAAALWTDSRYFLAAGQQLAGTPFNLMKDGLPETPSVADWLAANTEPGARIGVDLWVFSVAEYRHLADALCPHNRLLTGADDPAATLWTDRPALPADPIRVQPLEYAGQLATDKVAALRRATAEAGCTHLLVTALDEVAWTLNLRGTDVHCNPVFVGYLLLSPDGATLYVDPAKVTDEVCTYLSAQGVGLRPYGAICDDLTGLRSGRLLLSPTANFRLFMDAQEAVDVDVAPSPVAPLKAVKNDAEIAGFRRAMERDGVALVRWLRWLYPAVAAGGQTEMSIDRKLSELRAASPLYRGPSFDTIAGYGPHGAIVHYEATPDTDAPLEPRGLLLVDTGAQYLDGTTDITRTLALGPVSDEERRVYTLVLKGHIALSRCRFPDGACGTQLDALAREALWHEGLNYGHGTGHGVGAYLNVHEGPHQIRMNYMPAPLRAGMTVTDEPGVYVAGHFGVRLENTLLVRHWRTTDFGRFLEFEPLTLCPFDRAPIDRALLRPDEVAWLDDYHAEVRHRLLPLLDDEADRQWLTEATRPLHDE